MTEPTVTQGYSDMAFARIIVDAVEQGCTYEDRCIAVKNILARHRTAAHAAGLAEGVALGIEAAAAEAVKGRNYWRDKCEATKNRRESRDYETMAIACVHIEHAAKALDPAAIIAAHRAKDTKP